MGEILVEVRAKAAHGDLSGKAAMPESFMKRVDETRQSLQEIAGRLSAHLDGLERWEALWQLLRSSSNSRLT